MDNIEIARCLEEVADLLEIQGGNPFRVRAYRTAARTIESVGEPIAALVKREGPSGLTELAGIGKDLAGKIVGLLETGELSIRSELVRTVPEGLVAMMRVAGLGPKRARLLYDELGIQSLEALEQAARSERLRTVRGFGETLEGRILQGCAELKARTGRVYLAEAEIHVAALLEDLRKIEGVEEVAVAGSYRRRKETVGDVDILIAAPSPESIGRRLLDNPEIHQVTAQGATKCSFVLRSGLKIDVRIVEPGSLGAAMHYFTGSKSHNIRIRTLGLKRGLKISEYGVYRGDQRISGKTEEQVFRAVGLPWIPPELREDAGEIEAARQGRLPALVELRDLRGDLQMHTTYTDGKNTLAEMVEACRARGYEYIAITDHTKVLAMTGGLDRAGFREQAREIERLRASAKGMTILRGAEVDILEDGSLDLDDHTLGELDVVLAAVHTKMGLDEAAMTRRVLRALAHPSVAILAHPTGRRIGKREPFAIDMAQIARAAASLGVLLEINAQPERLDLKDIHVRMAKDAGAKMVISTDAHRISELDYLRYGVDQARRGWCTPADIANTLRFEEFRALKGRRKRALPEVGREIQAPAAPASAVAVAARRRSRPRTQVRTAR